MLDYSTIGLALVAAGIIVIMIASVLSVTGQKREGTGSSKAAGVIMIGPIPIIFGTDAKWVVVAIILAIILVALELVATFR
jgi:uncharacterized protein (TIGR00304 family)